MLRAGGNAVDAAVAAVLMSFVAESPLTGPGRRRLHARPHGGRRGPPARLLRRRARARARRSASPRELVPIDVRFSEDAVQRFNVGPSSCGAYGTTLGLARGARALRHACALGDLTAAPARAAREGVEVVPMQAFLFEVLAPILTLHARVRGDLRARTGGCCARATRFRLPELGDLLERLGAEGPGFLYSGDVAARGERLGARARRPAHAARTSPSYEVIEREPARVDLPAAARCSPTRRRRRAGS